MGCGKEIYSEIGRNREKLHVESTKFAEDLGTTVS